MLQASYRMLAVLLSAVLRFGATQAFRQRAEVVIYRRAPSKVTTIEDRTELAARTAA
jgi:hypothetical protein